MATTSLEESKCTNYPMVGCYTYSGIWSESSLDPWWQTIGAMEISDLIVYLQWVGPAKLQLMMSNSLAVFCQTLYSKFHCLNYTHNLNTKSYWNTLKPCIWNVYLSFCSGFGKVSTSVTAGNIEGVITSLIAGVQPSLHYEGVGGTPVHGDIWNKQTVQVPWDPPATGTCIRKEETNSYLFTEELVYTLHYCNGQLPRAEMQI